jgi:hypothetical protein
MLSKISRSAASLNAARTLVSMPHASFGKEIKFGTEARA